ncbi:MAG: hypothetical protein Q4G00_01900 [Clostridia bacterium]|nr:hypothetical protein [Clostridia bacterium]
MTEHRFTMRLDDRYVDEHAAWQKLNDIQRRTHLSFNRIVVDAINAYEHDQLRLSAQDEKRLVVRTADAVADKLQQMLPAYLAGYSAGATVPAVVPTARPVSIEPPLKAAASSDDDMPDFSGSVMDFDFMGS